MTPLLCSMNAFQNKLTKKKEKSNLKKQRKGYHLEVFWTMAVRKNVTGGEKYRISVEAHFSVIKLTNESISKNT